MATPLEARDPAVAQGPRVRLLLDDLALAPTAACAETDRGDHRIPTVEELAKLVSGSVKELRAVSKSLRNLGWAATGTGVDCLGGIDVFDIWGGEF